ncbi:unnamed protein product [Linum trigynum]|uniref:Uncharacterized protein n=1 Tax=Linum trigynum TaxID=586398 RepID=A0AAV2EMW4_9ROSI
MVDCSRYQYNTKKIANWNGGTGGIHAPAAELMAAGAIGTVAASSVAVRLRRKRGIEIWPILAGRSAEATWSNTDGRLSAGQLSGTERARRRGMQSRTSRRPFLLRFDHFK